MAMDYVKAEKLISKRVSFYTLFQYIKWAIRHDKYGPASHVAEFIFEHSVLILSHLKAIENQINLYERFLDELKDELSKKPVNHKKVLLLAAGCREYIIKIKETLNRSLEEGEIKIK